jgi:Ser/Thr protein kinase RdoA (MazF antagonist)
MDLRRHLLAELGASDAEELVGGHQSRVFLMSYTGAPPTIAKVLDGVAVDWSVVEARVEVVAHLAEINSEVCRPIAYRGRLVTEIVADDAPAGLLTLYEYADGAALEPANAADATQMGRALAGLHRSMARMPATDLPVVAALQGLEPGLGGEHQILHGDFNAGNVRQKDGVIRIFDLDDCGYGPVEFDVANALYMVLFDAVTGKRPESYETFAIPFKAAYCAGAGVDLSRGVVVGLIARRINALGRWIDDPHSAPIGIRNSTPEWREVLRAFVHELSETRAYERAL